MSHPLLHKQAPVLLAADVPHEVLDEGLLEHPRVGGGSLVPVLGGAEDNRVEEGHVVIPARKRVADVLGADLVAVAEEIHQEALLGAALERLLDVVGELLAVGGNISLCDLLA